MSVLQGGPYDGAIVEDTGNVLNATGNLVADGYVARYKPKDGRKRENSIYVFDGLSKVIATISRPGG